MPGNIKEFESPIDKLQPSETGAETLARMGRVEKENYDEAGRMYGGLVRQGGKEVDDFEYNQEVSQGAAALAVMHNNMITSWNKTTAATDPNDSTIQQKFIDSSNDQLSSWEGSFTTKRGQEWATNAADSMSNHLWEKTSADMGTRAGIAAVNNLTTTVRNMADTAGKDFTTLDQSLSQVDKLLAAQTEVGYIAPKQQAVISSDMKNELVKSSLKNLADRKPEQAMAAIQSGKFSDYMSAGEEKQLSQYAQVQAHGQQIDAARKQQTEQYMKQEKSVKANSDYMGQLVSGKTPLASQIISDTNLSTQQKAAWVSKNGILALPENTLRSPEYGDNFGRAAQGIYDGKALSPDGILAGVRRGEFTPNGAAQLQKLAAMAKTPAGVAEMNAQKPILRDAQNDIVKGVNDPNGQKLYNQYLHTFYQTWDANIQKGITPAQMADPKSKEYLGNLTTQFKRNDAQAIADVTKASAQKPAKAAAVKQWVIQGGKLVQVGQ